jgi:hypothetical protein
MEGDRWKWGKLMVACVDALRVAQTDAECPFVDHEVIPPFTGSPDGVGVWFICSTKKKRERFEESELSRQTEALKRKMSEVGFPPTAITTVDVSATSLEEIEEKGGRFAYFR